VAQLERMIGRDLSHWDPEHAAVATAEATA
jgi:hypothetical protein